MKKDTAEGGVDSDNGPGDSFVFRLEAFSPRRIQQSLQKFLLPRPDFEEKSLDADNIEVRS